MASDIYLASTSHPDRFRAEGYAWGILRPESKWLTVLGSHWENIPLTEHPADAIQPGITTLRDGAPEPYTLAKVRRDGKSVFLVLEVVRIYPGQIWSEIESDEDSQSESIVITGVSPKNNMAFFVSTDPNKPDDPKSCSLMAFWPKELEDDLHPIEGRTGLYRLISEAPPKWISVLSVSIESARKHASNRIASLMAETPFQDAN